MKSLPFPARMLLIAALLIAASCLTQSASAQWVPISQPFPLAEAGHRFDDVMLASDADGEFLALWLDLDDKQGQGVHSGQRFDIENLVDGSAFITGQVDSFARRQTLAMGVSGEFVVTWDSGYTSACPPNEGPDCDFYASYGRKFDRDGSPSAGTFRITDGLLNSTDRSNEGTSPNAAFDEQGNVLIAWVDDLDQAVRTRLYGPDSSPLGDYRTVAEQADSFLDQPESAHRPGGGFTVVWSEAPDGGTTRSHWLRHLDGSGNPIGEAILIADAQPFASIRPRIAYAEDGRGMVVWLDSEAADSAAPADRIQSRAISADGTLSPTLRIAALDEDGLQNPKVSALRGDDGFAVAWRSLDTSTLEARRLTLDGEPIGEISTLAVTGAQLPIFETPAWDVQAGPNGELIVAWENETATMLLAQRFGPACESSHILCLGQGDRFRVQVNWRVESGGAEGRGTVRDQQTLDTGSFWFFGAENIELVVKVLDGRPINGHFWVFYGSLSDVAFDLEITDTSTGRRALYQNVSGTQASQGDTEALPSD